MPGTYISPAETGLYYLNSRYYYAEVGRFISADNVGVVEASITPIADKNMFAYCDNNPVVRVDVTGYVWETAFDIVTLVISVADVASEPSDPLVWVGLVADLVDLIPVVTGVGEAVRAIRMSKKAIDAVDDIQDTGKKLSNLGEISSKVIVKNGGEVKLPTQIKYSEATDLWDEFLGKNQTDYNIFTGKTELNRIFSTDGMRSIRFGNHEINSIGTNKAHFHYEYWEYEAKTNTVTVFNRLQRMK